MTAFTQAERSFLSTRTTAHIATASPAGLPDVATVTFELDGESLVVQGADLVNTARFRNVLTNPCATVIVDDHEITHDSDSRGVKAYGVATIEQRPHGVIIRLTPEAVMSWAINAER